MEQTIDPALTYGSATRTLYHGPLSAANDTVTGGAGMPKNAGLSAATLSGTHAARGQVNANGPAAGAWSNSVIGSGAARGIAFRTYQNTTSGPLSFKVNAVFDGKFLAAPYRLPLGTLKAGAAIHVFDTEGFATRVGAATGGSAQFLLGSYAPAVAADPNNAFNNLRGLFPGSVLGMGQTVVTAGSAPVNAAVSTTTVTVAPQQKFTVMYDVATSSVGQTVLERSASGVANFLNTLAPAAVHFTGLAGEAITGLAIADAAPTPTPAPSTIGLAPAASTHPAGGTASVTATVTRSSNAPSLVAGENPSTPVANTPVEFYVTAGPNVGKTGIAITNAQGSATFGYVGDNGVGKDVVQARIAALESSTVEHTWTAPKCPQNQVFWLKYPGLWPLTTLSIGGQDYDQATLIALLKLQPKNPSLALLQQVAVTKLNTAYGGDTSRLTLYLLAADKLLVNFNRAQPSQNQVSTQTSIEMVALAARLAIYNIGLGSNGCKS